MPTASSLSQVTFHNAGPLTTTFTAPSSCRATSGRMTLAPTSAPSLGIWGESCAPSTAGDCYPGGRERDIYVSAQAANYKGVDAFYYSPGIVCPASWTTAGVAVKYSNGSMALTGIFGPGTRTSSTTATPRSDAVIINPIPNIFVEALGPGETGVVCCPSQYTANVGGGCYSNLPRESYTVSTGCQQAWRREKYTLVVMTFTSNGIAITASGLSITATDGPAFSTRITSLGQDTSTYTGLVSVAMVTLVHKIEDLPSSTAAPSPTSTSAASSWRAGSRHGAAGVALIIWFLMALGGDTLIFTGWFS